MAKQSKYREKQKKKARTEVTHRVQLVAAQANPRHSGSTKREKRLAIRIRDYEKMDDKLKNPPAFHQPGSLK